MMEYNKIISKTDDILTWLDVNDAGALDSAIRGIIAVARVEKTKSNTVTIGVVFAKCAAISQTHQSAKEHNRLYL